MLKSINPATDEVIKSYKEMTRKEVRGIISNSYDEFLKWRRTDFADRKNKMKRAADILRNRKEEFAKIMTLEMGKPVTQSRGEVEKCAWVCDYFADNAEEFLKDQPITTDASNSFVTFQPLGVVLAVMPWNFPFWQVFRFAAPNIMAGNVGVLKHASNVSGCALAIEEIFKAAGFPENVFRTILLPSAKMDFVIADERISAVTLTGSVPAGKAIAQQAGSLIKKSVLELGGSDPYLVLEDADLEKTVNTCVTSRLINGGQSCIAAKRFIVVDKVFNKFEEMYVETMKQKKMGDPFDESVDLGPQASKRLRDDLHNQVERSKSKGAKVLLGGKVPEGKGAYYAPSVLSNVSKGMPAFDEELFGPVAALIKVKDEKEGIAVANATSFGLGAAVFTQDIERGKRIAAEEFAAGCCFVNEFVKSDPRLPFGGIKESGYGRELSAFGIKEFVNIKTVYVK
jgi:succinate-semialdehyde dehydrogenase / glutarate-semialdehyde dehydrogenase